MDNKPECAAGKRKRQQNFSSAEKMDLFMLMDKFKHVIENKATDKTSNSSKEQAWKEITNSFNATSSSGVFRDKESLKRFHENRKKYVKKILAKNKQELLKTGGGPMTIIEVDVADKILIEIINKKTVEGLLNPFDSDNITIIETHEKTHGLNQNNPQVLTMLVKYKYFKYFFCCREKKTYIYHCLWSIQYNF